MAKEFVIRKTTPSLLLFGNAYVVRNLMNSKDGRGKSSKSSLSTEAHAYALGADLDKWGYTTCDILWLYESP